MISQKVCSKLKTSDHCEALVGEIDSDTHTIYVKSDGDRDPDEVIQDLLKDTDYRYKRPSEVVPEMRSSTQNKFIITKSGKIDEILDTVRDIF